MEQDDDTPARCPHFGTLYQLLCWGIWWSITCECGETPDEHWGAVERHIVEHERRGAVTDE